MGLSLTLFMLSGERERERERERDMCKVKLAANGDTMTTEVGVCVVSSRHSVHRHTDKRTAERGRERGGVVYRERGWQRDSERERKGRERLTGNSSRVAVLVPVVWLKAISVVSVRGSATDPGQQLWAGG